MNSNQIIESQYFNEDIRISILVNVSNTYPLFLKIQEDMKQNIFLYDSLRDNIRTQYEKYSLYAERLNGSLIEFTKEVYESAINMGHPYYEVILEWMDYKILQIKYNGYNLLMLKGYNDLIFLNYTKEQIHHSRIKEYLIPTEIPHGDSHIKKMTYLRKPYRAVNTYNSFIAFADYLKEEPSRRLNTPFYGSFSSSIEATHNDIPSARAHKEVMAFDDNGNSILGHNFKFYEVEDVLLVTNFIDIEKEANNVIELVK